MSRPLTVPALSLLLGRVILRTISFGFLLPALIPFLPALLSAQQPLPTTSSAGITELPVAFNVTPTFTTNAGITNFTITLTGNVTASAFSSKAVGTGSFRICQDPTGGRTFAWMANAIGFGVVDPTPSACSLQNWKWDGVNLRATGRMVSDAATALGGGTGYGNPGDIVVVGPNGHLYRLANPGAGIWCLSWTDAFTVPSLVSCPTGGASIHWSTLTSGQWAGLTSGQWASLAN